MDIRSSGMKVPLRPAPGLPVERKQSPERRSETCDPFSPQKLKNERKKPPPRPPPPRINQSSNHFRSIFGSSKRNSKKGAATAIVKPLPPSTAPGIIPTGTLIDLSPPSSPKTQKNNNESVWNIRKSTKNSSQLESGFEDDFSSILSSGATTPSVSDPWSDFSSSPEPLPLSKAPNCTSGPRPTIICMPRVKPSRPPPPPLLEEDFLPMPSVPPPPPPPEVLQVLANGPALPPRPHSPYREPKGSQSLCVALYDYESSHPDDLQFKTGDRIIVITTEGEEWLRGRLKGKEGMFPRSYVRLLSEPAKKPLMWAIALFPFTAESWDDLDLKEDDKVKVLDRVNEDWLYGEIGGRRGQFPEAFVQDITEFESEDI